MTCPSFGSSSEVSLWYAADAEIVVNSLGEASQLSATPTEWSPVPMTGEAINTNLAVSISGQITSNRSYANSLLTRGEVVGTINFEAQANTFLYDMLICALQANFTTSFEGGSSWLPMVDMRNASSKHCFALLRRVPVSGGYDWYVYRGCQVGGISFEISPNALITGVVSFTGIRPDDVIEAQASVTDWTFLPETYLPLMSGGGSLKNFFISSWNAPNWETVDVTMQSISLAIDNQLRSQGTVNTGSIYSGGIGSGRFRATFSGSAYYSNPALYTALLNDTRIRIGGRLLDSEGDGFEFESTLAKVVSREPPMAGGPEQDIIVGTEFQAFEDLVNGTLRLTKYTGEAVMADLLARLIFLQYWPEELEMLHSEAVSEIPFSISSMVDTGVSTIPEMVNMNYALAYGAM